MIATIIPFFLFASVPQETTWQHGLEYNFSSLAEVQLSGINGTLIYGVNLTNSLVCQPMSEITLKCRFSHTNMKVYELNHETGEMKSKEERFPRELDEFKPFVFEIEFDNKGVRIMWLNHTIAKDHRIGEALSMVDLLNVGVDLSSLTKGILMKEVRQSNSFLLGECMATVKFGFNSDSEPAMEGQWNLDLSSPMEKLAGRSFSVKKNWDLRNCKRFQKFLWAMLPVHDIMVDNELKNVKYDGDMSVHRNTFKSSTYHHWERKVKNKTVQITESNSLTLDGIYAAGEEWPEIENPKMIVFSNNEVTN